MRFRTVTVGAVALAVVAIAVLIASLIRIGRADAGAGIDPSPGTPAAARARAGSRSGRTAGPAGTAASGITVSPGSTVPSGITVPSLSPTRPPVTVPPLVTASLPAGAPLSDPGVAAASSSPPGRAPAGATSGRSGSHGALSPPATAHAPAGRTSTAGASATGDPRRSGRSGSSAPGAGDARTSSAPSHVDPISPAPGASAASARAAVARAVDAAAAEGITESVVVLDRSTGRQVVAVNADRAVPAVSIAKLLFATDELDRAGGGAHLDADALEDLDDMISQSDDDLADDYYGANGEGAIVQRVAQRYHLAGTDPAPNPRYWGGITVTAADVASLLRQVLSDPADSRYLADPMLAATVHGSDGFDQEFGMNAVAGAGSKQGWGCCLGGVVAIHSAGFDARNIVVVLSTAPPDAPGLDVPQVSAFADDPGFRASVAAVTATAKAAVDP